LKLATGDAVVGGSTGLGEVCPNAELPSRCQAWRIVKDRLLGYVLVELGCNMADHSLQLLQSK